MSISKDSPDLMEAKMEIERLKYKNVQLEVSAQECRQRMLAAIKVRDEFLDFAERYMRGSDQISLMRDAHILILDCRTA